MYEQLLSHQLSLGKHDLKKVSDKWPFYDLVQFSLLKVSTYGRLIEIV